MVKCIAKLKSGKPCKKEGVLEGLCTVHFTQKYKLNKKKYVKFVPKHYIKI